MFAKRDTCDLYMDIFRPTEGSETTFQGHPKPAVIFVFGGGFIMGERSHSWYRPWYQILNDNGYPVITIDYRLGMKDYKVGKGLSGTLKASNRFHLSQQVGVEDVFSAVSFLAENKDSLGIDPSNLVLSGCSAGAIISLACAYDIARGRTQGLPEGFNFKGVMSFAGAIISTSGAPKFDSLPCPILLLHGTADKAVAYNRLAFMGKGLWGSNYLSRKWDQKGFDNYCIYRFTGIGHDVAVYMENLWEVEKEFLEKNVILGAPRHVDATIKDPSLPRRLDVSVDDIYKN